MNVTTAVYDRTIGYGDPMPNATYDWRADYTFTGNGSIHLDSHADHFLPNGSWDYRDSYRADCEGNLTGDLAFLYNATERQIEVGFTVALNESCPVRKVFEFADGRFQNDTHLLSGPDGGNEFLDSTVAWSRMQAVCGDRYYGAVCPVQLANGTATLRDVGAVSTLTFKNYMADFFGFWTVQDWDLGMAFRIGHP